MSDCMYCGGDCPNQEEYMCDGYAGDIDGLYKELIMSKWEDNSIQFPRLIAEAVAAGVWDDKSDAFRLMCDSMDLEPKEVFEVIDRAQKEWEKIVANIPKTPIEPASG